MAPLSGWKIDELASVSRETELHCNGRFTLGIGSGRLIDAPIRAMREAIETLHARLPESPVYLGALGPQMLRLAGERYDGAALNWCSASQVRWSRARVTAAARAAGRDATAVRIHEYVRVCVDEDEPAARLSLAKTVLTYALRPNAARTTGYRAHFTRMGFGAVLEDLERRRAAGAGDDELAGALPDTLLREVGYWGGPAGAGEAFENLAAGLDIAVVRLVPARRSDAEAVRLAMEACAPRGR